jgi:hypothetical protein
MNRSVTAQHFHFIILKLKLTNILKTEKSEGTFLPHVPTFGREKKKDLQWGRRKVGSSRAAEFASRSCWNCFCAATVKVNPEKY